MEVNKKRILAICESDPGTQRLMDIFSTKLGFQAYIKKSCVELMSGLQGESIIPDMIFLQPSNHFDEAFGELQRNPVYHPYKNLPIVAVTTDPRERHFHKLTDLGIAAVILKPFSFQDLKNIIHKLHPDYQKSNSNPV